MFHTPAHKQLVPSRDMADKLERFGSFASERQAEFAAKLVGWSGVDAQEGPKSAPGGVFSPRPVPSPSPAPEKAPETRLPRLFELMQRLSKLTIGKLVIARKNQDSLCWIKVAGHDGLVGKIQDGALSVFTARLNLSVHGMSPADITAALQAIEADPEAAAVQHGKASGRCAVCSRDMTDPASIERGIGPTCMQRFQC